MKKKKRYYLPTTEIDEQIAKAIAKELKAEPDLKISVLQRMALREYLNIK